MEFTKDKVSVFFNNMVEWCLYVLIFAVAFSNSIVEIASTVMIVAWVLSLLLKNSFSRMKFPAAFLLGAYFLWVILSCFNSAHASESFRGIFKALQYAMVFMAAATQSWTASKVKKFLWAAAGAVFLTGANGLYQYVSGEDLIRGRTLIPDDHLKRISSSFIHPNDFGAYLMVTASLLVSVVFACKDRVKNALYFFIPLAVSGVCLFLTGSRGAWMSFAAAFMVIGLLKGRKTAMVFIAALAAIFFLMPSSSRQRIYETADLKSGTAWERVMIWRGSADMIKERPVLGFGVNTFSKHFPEYKPAEYPDDRYAHNCYLQMASEIGIPGALLFMAFLAAALFSSLRGIRAMPCGGPKDLAVGLFGGSVGFVLNSAVDTHLFSLTLAVFFNVLLGSLLSLSRGLGDGK